MEKGFEMMEKAIISSSVDLLDGGCNVCGIIEDVNYTLTLKGQRIPLEEVTVNTLVMAVVLQNGFKREYKMDVLDDYVLFNKDDRQVTLKEEYDRLTYSNNQTQLETRNQLIDHKELTDKVNDILTSIFSLAELSFEF